MTTNCRNCGAPIETQRASCPFCGTRYQLTAQSAHTVPIDDVVTCEERDDLGYLNKTFVLTQEAGLLTPNEWRSLIGLPTIEKEKL